MFSPEKIFRKNYTISFRINQDKVLYIIRNKLRYIIKPQAKCTLSRDEIQPQRADDIRMYISPQASYTFNDMPLLSQWINKKELLVDKSSFLLGCNADLDAHGFCKGSNNPLAMMGVAPRRYFRGATPCLQRGLCNYDLKCFSIWMVLSFSTKYPSKSFFLLQPLILK